MLTRARYLQGRLNIARVAGKSPSRLRSSPSSVLSTSRFRLSSRLSTQKRTFLAELDRSELLSYSRGQERVKETYTPGDVIEGYKVIETRFYPERNFTAILLQHEKTGAHHLHIDTADSNNVFMTTFRTPPQNSTGIAHVLEHTTLCGSENYRIRDPFFNMIKRSLQSYMNAWTVVGPDYTSYPFSTQNAKDFYNIMSVYLDAVYHPNLDEYDFLQEGHRFEFTKEKDLSSSLEIKGIVYNEMKGAMADSSRVYHHDLLCKLYPNTPYAHNSGGDPESIPDLTWQELRDFHKTNYHPSNSYTSTYELNRKTLLTLTGDLPLRLHLKCIDSVISKFERREQTNDVPLVQRYASPVRHHVYGPPPTMGVEGEGDCKLSVSFLLNLNKDDFMCSIFHILSNLLMDGPNAPLYQSLIESNIGNSWSPGSGYDDSLKETMFSVGLSGIKEEDADKVERIIIDTLQKAAAEGFPEERINAIIHQIELHQKHVHADFGLDLVAGVSHSWIHGGSPLNSLDAPAVVKKLKEKLAEGPFFQNLIKEHLLNNSHKVTLLMTADETYATKKIDIEKEKISKSQANLTYDQRQDIVRVAAELKVRQEQKQERQQLMFADPNVLPTLELEDVQRVPNITLTNHTTIRNVDVHWVPQPTNGIVYYRMQFNINHIPEDLIEYIPLFTTLATSIGGKELDKRRQALLMDAHTGGLSLSADLLTHPTTLDKMSLRIHAGSYALAQNVEHLLKLWSDIFAGPRFDDIETLRTQIDGIYSNFQDSLIDNGHALAQRHAASFLRSSNSIGEKWSGLSQYQLLRKLTAEEDLTEVSSKLKKRIATLVFQDAPMKIAVNAEESNFAATSENISSFLSSVERSDAVKNGSINEYLPNVASKYSETLTYVPLPMDTNHAALVLPGIYYTSPDYPAFIVLSKVLKNAYLHREIREKGGAYGGGASASPGLFGFFSYRDPNARTSLQHFEDSLSWAAKTGNIENEHLKEAKLNIFAAVDRPKSPQHKGLRTWLSDITEAQRQTHRERLLDLRVDEVQFAADQLLLNRRKGNATVIGSEESKSTFIFENSRWTEWKGDKDE